MPARPAGNRPGPFTVSGVLLCRFAVATGPVRYSSAENITSRIPTPALRARTAPPRDYSHSNPWNLFPLLGPRPGPQPTRLAKTKPYIHFGFGRRRPSVLPPRRPVIVVAGLASSPPASFRSSSQYCPDTLPTLPCTAKPSENKLMAAPARCCRWLGASPYEGGERVWWEVRVPMGDVMCHVSGTIFCRVHPARRSPSAQTQMRTEKHAAGLRLEGVGRASTGPPITLLRSARARRNHRLRCGAHFRHPARAPALKSNAAPAATPTVSGR